MVGFGHAHCWLSGEVVVSTQWPLSSPLLSNRLCVVSESDGKRLCPLTLMAFRKCHVVQQIVYNVSSSMLCVTPSLFLRI